MSNKNIYNLTILPLAILVCEPVIFFFPFWVIIDFFEENERNITKSLKQLNDLFKSGVLSEEEFIKAKKKIWKRKSIIVSI